VKSYFLDHVSSIVAAETALRIELPGQEHPWLLRNSNGEVVAYLYVASELDGENNVHVQADISGKQYNEDTKVIELLQRLQKHVGGSISDDA
jgi:hypothetical protein